MKKGQFSVIVYSFAYSVQCCLYSKRRRRILRGSFEKGKLQIRIGNGRTTPGWDIGETPRGSPVY